MTAVAKKASPIMSLAGKKSWETRRARMLNPPKPKKLPKMEPHKKIVLPKAGKTASASEIMMKTVVMVLTFRGIGNRRQVDQSDIEVRAGSTDKEWLNTTKKLIDAEELEAISSLDGEARRYVESRALPSYIKRGVYLLSNELVNEVDTRLKDYKAKRQPLVDTLVSKLRTLKTDARARLGTLYNEDDYPTASELRDAFEIHWRYLHVDSMKDREGISREIYEAELKKAEQDWAETRDAIKQMLRGEFAEKVNHFIDRLTPDDEGRPKSFREGSVNKFEDFLNTFNPRDVTNDVQMRELVQRAKSLLKVSDVDTIRTDESVRDYIRKGFENIKVLLDPMVLNATHRRIKVAD